MTYYIGLYLFHNKMVLKWPIIIFQKFVLHENGIECYYKQTGSIISFLYILQVGGQYKSGVIIVELKNTGKITFLKI